MVTRLDSGPLSELLGQLNLTKNVARNEDSARLHVYENVPAANVQSLTFAAVRKLFTTYGNAINAVRIDHMGVPIIDIGHQTTQAEFEAQRNNLLTGVDTYKLQLEIDKNVLVQLTLGEKQPAVEFWFFASSLEAKIENGLQELQNQIWGEQPDAGRLVLVGDTDLYNEGPLVKIIGGAERLFGNSAVLRPGRVDQRLQDGIKLLRDSRSQNVNWDHIETGRLTPLHLALDKAPGPTRLETLWSLAFVDLCLLYLCNLASRGSDGQLRVEYRGKSTVGFSVPEPTFHRGQPATNLDTFLPEQTQEALRSFDVLRPLRELVEWCYHQYEGDGRNVASDRLQFTQVSLAHRLESVPEERRLITLLGQVESMLSDVKYQWSVFIQGEIEAYDDNVRKLEELLQRTVQEFAERANALGKNLSDAMLGAIAVLIGSAIAAAFKTPFNAALFRVGVLAYTVYLIFFPGLYGTWSQHVQFEQASKLFDDSKLHFRKFIDESSVEKAVGEPIERARDHYNLVQSLTIVGFVVAAVGAIVLAVVVPFVVS